MKLFLLVLLIVKVAPTAALDLLDIAWQTQEQIAKAQYDAGEFDKSVQLFGDKSWQANALYKAGKFDSAAEHFKALGQDYNYGNALAQQAKYAKAIELYEKIDENSLDYTDAQHNLEIVKQLQQQQQKKQEQQEQQQQQSQQDKQQEQQQDSKESNKDNENDKDSKSSDKTDKEQQEQYEKKQEEQQEAQDKENQEKQQAQSEGKSEKEDKEDNEKEASKEKSEAQQQSVKQQTDKQRLEQIFKQVKTQPIELLKQKFLIEQYLRQQQDSALSNTRGKISW